MSNSKRKSKENKVDLELETAEGYGEKIVYLNAEN